MLRCQAKAICGLLLSRAAQLISLAAWHVAFRTFGGGNRWQHDKSDRGDEQCNKLLHMLDPKQTIGLR